VIRARLGRGEALAREVLAFFIRERAAG
jgi:hypothetical protein